MDFIPLAIIPLTDFPVFHATGFAEI